MRIRSVKPEFFLHEGLYEAEIQSGLPLRLAFVGLWCAADREGRFKWRPRQLKTQILPYDSDVDFSRVLDACVTRGFIERYASGGEEYGWIPTFARHQVINNREKDSELPDPCDPTTSTRAPRVLDACPTRLVQDQGEGKGKEGNMEGKGKERKALAAPVVEAEPVSEWEVAPGIIIPSGFQTPECKEAIEFWLAYKKEKRDAYKPQGLKALMSTIAKDFTPETLVDAIRRSAAIGYRGFFPPKPQNHADHTNGSRHPPRRHAEDKQIQEHIELPMLN